MKLNLFTPLPPARTDIGQCMARLLPALARKADVTLWTDQEKFDAKLKSYAKIRTYKADSVYWPDLSFADFNIYNVGNDARFHAGIVDVALRAPGIVIMHDVVVSELAYHALASGAALGDQPFTWWPLQGACGVISHNVEALYHAMPDLKLPVLDVPLPWLPVASMAAPHAHERGRGRLEMVICGYLNSPSRRLVEVLDAMADYPRRDSLFLHVVGEVEKVKELRLKIESSGLSKNVKLHGFLSEDALGRLLERVHMALNLRWPTVGEASGAQLRFWNHSLPTLVTNTGWYSRQPAGSVLFVDPEREKADLHKHWDAALDDYAGTAAVGLAGRGVLQVRHSAEVFTDALMDFLPVAAEVRKTVFVPKLARRAGLAIAGSRLPGNVSESLSARVAEQIAGISGLGRETF